MMSLWRRRLWLPVRWVGGSNPALRPALLIPLLAEYEADCKSALGAVTDVKTTINVGDLA